MQGVVFAARIDEMNNDGRLLTRFDIDQGFGTEVNRFWTRKLSRGPCFKIWSSIEIELSCCSLY